ncbi:MAG TPA: hypothetical protein PLR83_06690 [Pyrinomonadaceae bacterium]|nr:hypothetical protein [Pyrinomonadaceae bacterium]
MENVSTSEEPQKDSRIGFTAHFTKTDDSITIEYKVVNGTNGDIYVLDAQPWVDRESKTARAEANTYYLCSYGDNAALVLRGIFPLPISPVSQRVMPLATKLEPNGQLERKFSVAIPLREQNDLYVPQLEADRYTKATADRILLRVQYLRTGGEDFKAAPVSYAPGYFSVSTKQTVKDAGTLQADLPIGSVVFLKRPDLFSRVK